MFNETRTLRDRGMEAAQRFLERKGYKIVAVDTNDVDFVADDDGAIVFIRFDISKAGAFKDERWTRQNAEGSALQYFCENECEPDCTVRFDYLSMLCAGSDRALLRYHMNCFETEVA